MYTRIKYRKSFKIGMRIHLDGFIHQMVLFFISRSYFENDSRDFRNIIRALATDG